MQITHIYPHFNKLGGVERYLWELTARQAQAGDDVRVLCQDFHRGSDYRIQVTTLPNASRVPAWSVYRFAKKATQHLAAVDGILHAQGASTFRADVITAQSCHKAWYTLSKAQLTPYSSVYWRKVFNPIHRTVMTIETEQYRPGNFIRVVAISKSIRNELMQHYHVPREKIPVIYSGTNFTDFSPERRQALRSAARERWQIPERAFCLSFAANEFRRKGLATILRSMSALTEYPVLHLIIAGRGDAAEFAETLAATGLRPRVHFLGPVAQMSEFYAAADAFVFPTLYEPFGLVITEAMAMGLPTITSEIAGAAELIKHDHDGILLKSPGDAAELTESLRRLLRNPDAAHRLGSQGAESIRPHSWEYVAQQYRDVYSDVLAVRGQP